MKKLCCLINIGNTEITDRQDDLFHDTLSKWNEIQLPFAAKIFTIILVIAVSSPVRGGNYKGFYASNHISTIAFGSCAHQDKPQPVLDLIADKKPDIFVYLGDNIYNDSYRIGDLKKCYRKLSKKPEFIRLKESTRLLATWDDHDYGWDNSGKDYPYKKKSKKIFLDFFGIPDSSILKHEGIYYSRIFSDGNRKVQIIMLDNRTFRDRLLPYNGNRSGDERFNYRMDFSPHENSDSTMLGDEQWLWLEDQLCLKADLRIIATSTQFAVTHNGYEAWANFPHEQKRMMNLIGRTGACGVIFISGDVHYGEISRIKDESIYPLYDVTSSGITSTWEFATPNDNRIDGPVMENNYGMISINWDKSDPEIILQIIDVSGKIRISRKINLSRLKFR